MIIVETYEGEDPEQVGLVQSDGWFLFKNPLRIWDSLHCNHMCMVLVHGNHTRMDFSFKNSYAHSHCLHMGFPNPMPIPVLYPNHNGMGPNI